MAKLIGSICCVIVLLAIACVDVFFLISTRTLSRIVDEKLRAGAGSTLSYTNLTATVTGSITLDGVGVQLSDTCKILSADHATVSIGRRAGTFVAETIVLDSPRFNFSDSLLEELKKPHAGSKPLRDTIQSSELPRIICNGGTLEIVNREILNWDKAQAFQILDFALVPSTGYRYLLGGRMKSDIFGEWKINGEIDLETGEHQIVLATDRVQLGPAIREILAPKVQPHYDKYQPVGPAQIFVHLSYDRAKEGPEFRVTLKPLGVSMIYRDFALPCEGVTGEIDFFTKGFEIKNLRATNGKDIAVRFDGKSDGYEAEAGYEFRVELDRVKFDDRLRKALIPKPDVQKVIDLFEPVGEIDARLQIRRAHGENKEVSMPTDLSFRNTTFKYREYPYEINRSSGEIHVDGQEIWIKHLKGFHGDGELRFSGTLKSLDADPTIDLRIRAKALELKPDLRSALKESMRKRWDEFVPLGVIDLDLTVHKEQGQEASTKAICQMHDNRVCYSEIPIPMVVTEGQVEFDDGAVMLSHVKANLAVAGSIEINGELTPLEKGFKHHYVIDGKGVIIDDRLTKAMPKEVGDLLTVLKVTGDSSFKLTIDQRLDPKNEFREISLWLGLRKGLINSDIKVEDIDGEIVLNGRIDKGVPNFGGTLRIREARILKKRVTNFTSGMIINGTVITFPQIRADAYDGQLSGGLRYDTRTDDIECQFWVDRLSLKEFVQDTEKFNKKALSGRVRLEINNLKGKAQELKTLLGDGRISITDGQLLDVPGVVAFLDPASFGAERKFTSFRAVFDISDAAFQIKDFGFLGDEGAGSVVGRGRFGFDGHFKLKVKTITGSLFGFKFFLTDLPARIFDAIKSALEVTYEGTLEESEKKKDK